MTKKDPSTAEGKPGPVRVLLRWLQRRRGPLVAGLCVALAAGFLAWTWVTLQPRTWRYFTDETSLRRQARQVQPQAVVWENASRVDVPFADVRTNAAQAAFSADQQQLVFVQIGKNGSLDLFISRRQDAGWGPAEPLRALNSPFNETDPAFSRDGQYLYFATDRPGGPGGFDIWVARWDGETYAWPLPLTVTVNSKFNDTAPAVGGDRTLYFASDRPRDLPAAEQTEPAAALIARYTQRDFDIFYADAVPAGVTNVETERAQSILYSLRERALSDPHAMQVLGGSADSEAAVDRALAWLAGAQETNGMWSISRYEGQAGHDVASTAFALLAFYGRSERHDRPCRYRENVRLGLQWLLAQQNVLTGDLRGLSPAGNAMYDQSIGTLALAEAYGLTKDETLRQAVQSAVFFLVDAQHPTLGAWRYRPLEEPDLSVSGWGIMALKSAEFSGIHVQRRTFDLLKTFLKSVSLGESGGRFEYMPRQSTGTKAMIATGFFCSQLMGLSPNSRQAFEASSLVGTNGCLDDAYFLYYGTLSGYQFQGPKWRGWRDSIHRELLAAQATDGSWLLPKGHIRTGGRVIGTALVALSLQAHYRYTPLYGLGYEPPERPVPGATLSFNDLSEMPNYYDAARFSHVINAPGSDETDPAVSPHSDFLYLSSNRKGGMGGFDLYRSRIATRIPAACENLGREINGAGDDVGPDVWMQGFGLFFSKTPDAGSRAFELYGAMSRCVWPPYDSSDGDTIQREALDARPRPTLWSRPDPWTGSVTTPFIQGGPHLTPDDGHAIIAIATPGSADTDLHVADWTGHSWSASVPVEGANSVSNEYEGVISSDGRFLYLTSDRDGGCGAADIWVACRTPSNRWEVVAPLGGTVNTVGQERGVSLSADGRALYFSSDRGGGKGGYDLFRAILEWPPAQRMEGDQMPATPAVLRVERLNEISSSADDRDPALSPAGDLLYFSSNRQKGQGGYDLYVSRVIRGDLQSPENAGEELNGAGDECRPALRMQGFDMAYVTTLGTNTSCVVSVTRREVVEGLDDARWQSYLAMLDRIKWWVVAILASLLALVYLIRRYRDLTNRFHKCLMASAILHAAILFVVATWTVTQEVKNSMDTAALEMLVDQASLDSMENEIGTRKEAMALDQHKQTITLPAAAIPKMVSEQAREQVDLEEFAPASVGGAGEGGMTVPSGPKRAEQSLVEAVPVSSGQRDAPLAVTVSRELKTLQTELQMADVDQIAMEEPPAGSAAPSATIEVKLDTAIAQKSVSGEFKPSRPDETKAVSEAPSGSEVTRALTEPGSAAPVKTSGGLASASLVAALTRSVATGEAPVFRTSSGYDIPVAGLVLEVPAYGETGSGATNGVGGTVASGSNMSGGFDPAGGVARVGSSFQNGGGLGGSGIGGTGGKGLGNGVAGGSGGDTGDGHGTGGKGLGSGGAGGTGAGVGDVVGGAGTGGAGGNGSALSGSGGDRASAVGGVAPRAMGNPSPGTPIEGGSMDEILTTLAKRGGARAGTVRLGAPVEMDVPPEYANRNVPDLIVFSGRPSLEVVEALGGSGETEGSIRGSLNWLTRNQEPDGRWSCDRHGGQAGHDVAATSLALLCYYGWGMKHNVDCEFTTPVKNGIAWLLGQMKPDGDIRGGNANNGMYDQGIAGMVLCEAYGISRDPALFLPSSNAIAFIVRAQNKDGGWRYQPGAQDSDMSVFGWQFMALHSAKMSGIPVSSNALEKADNWLNRVSGGQFGGIYGYQAPNQPNASAMSACGMFCRQLQKTPPTDDRMKETAGLLRTRPLPGNNVDFYYTYYATLALYQHQGEVWEEWNTRMKTVLPPLQRKTGADAGSWDPQGQHGGQMGRCVTTAIGALSLEVYYRFLPMYGYRSADEEGRKGLEKGKIP